MKVIAFNGSPRPDGNTKRLLEYALAEIRQEQIETELVQLGGSNIRGCTACYECVVAKNKRCSMTEDVANGFIHKLLEADGVLLGSPTYFADITTETKAFIDRAGLVARANGNMYRRKVGAAVIAVRRGGAVHAFDSINHFFLISEMIVPGSSYWNIGVGHARGEVDGDEEGIRTMRTLGQNMAWLLKKIAG